MSTIRLQVHSIQFKKENVFQTYFPYHTIFSLIIGYHLGRHLGYIEMLNDARVASLGFFKDNVCTTRINKEKSLKSSSSETDLAWSSSLEDVRIMVRHEACPPGGNLVLMCAVVSHSASAVP